VYKHHQATNRKQGIAKLFVFGAIGLVLGAGVILYPKAIAYFERLQIEQENSAVLSEILQDDIVGKTIENIQNIPSEIEDEFATPVVILENAYLEVPFVCQAPLQTEANWIHHEESCEEAALLQVQYYIEGITEVDKSAAHDTIMDMIAWQEEHFGEHRDIYANDMKLFIQNYYGYEDDEVEIIFDVKITDIKKAISSGYPIIVPIMGDVLQNPYYPYPGYHMLTIIGYTPEKIITNDVGTRRGKDFSYTYDKFMRALDAAGNDIVIIKKKPAPAIIEEIVEDEIENVNEVEIEL
jgi:Peptidase_C39 like family